MVPSIYIGDEKEDALVSIKSNKDMFMRFFKIFFFIQGKQKFVKNIDFYLFPNGFVN